MGKDVSKDVLAQRYQIQAIDKRVDELHQLASRIDQEVSSQDDMLDLLDSELDLLLNEMGISDYDLDSIEYEDLLTEAEKKFDCK